MGMQTVSGNLVRSRCSWETYERLLKDNQDSSSPRFTYDQGWLEIMSPSLNHEKITAALRSLVQALGDYARLDYLGAGSTTFRRQDLQRGFEPDSSFYFRHAARMRPVDDIDLSTQPAPELVIKIELSRSSINMDVLYYAIGVEEVWRWTKNRLVILVRGPQEYTEQLASQIFPQASAKTITELVFQSVKLSRVEWNRPVKDWLDNSQ